MNNEIAPLTFTLPHKYEAQRLSDYMSAHDCTYISKPDEGSQGDGMQIFKTIKDLPLGLGERPCVV